MKQPEENRVGLTHRVLHYLAKRWPVKCVIALCAAAVLSLSTYQASSRLSAAAYMALNYENAEQGLYPNSTRFNMYDVISEDIAQTVIDRAGLNGQMTANQLLDCLSIAPRYTRATLERYIGSEYTIRLNLKKPAGNTTANELIMLLCEAYYESFVNRFAVNDVINDFALGDTRGYDYHDIAYLFSTRISHLSDYLSRRQNANGVFRSARTGETFSSLIKRIENFDSVLYVRYRSYIIESGITKDYDTYVAEMNYRQSLLRDEYDRAHTAYSLRMAAIGMYDPRQTAVVMIPTYDASNNFYMSKTRVGMDYIAEEARSSEEYANTIRQSILGNELKLSLLEKTYEDAADAVRVAEKADQMIADMTRELSEIINDVLMTDDDYVRYTLSEALSFHPRYSATIEEYGVKRSAVVFALLFVALSVFQQVIDEAYLRYAVKRRVVDVSEQDKEGADEA